MAWLRSADTEVKRDMEISRDEVRVMTVHGAKGLEAPVVIMVDTTSSPSDTQRLPLIQVPHEGGEVTVWAGRKADDPKAVAAARQAMLEEIEDEYRRLLYVAMTRAADRLIVAGIQPGNRNGVRQHCWYDLVGKGLASVRPAGRDHRHRRRPDQALHAAGGWRARDRRGGIDCDHVAAIAVMAAHANAAASDQRGLAASVASERRRSASRDVDGSDRAAHAGACSRARWCIACCNRCPICRPSGGATPRSRTSPATRPAGARPSAKSLAEKVIALIADSRFAAVFAEGSRAEVAIVGRLTLPGRPPALVSGQIDRLVVTPNEVLIVDFKTNHAPPDGRRRGAAGLCPPARAVPGGVVATLSPARRPRRAALDRNG